METTPNDDGVVPVCYSACLAEILGSLQSVRSLIEDKCLPLNVTEILEQSMFKLNSIAENIDSCVVIENKKEEVVDQNQERRDMLKGENPNLSQFFHLRKAEVLNRNIKHYPEPSPDMMRDIMTIDRLFEVLVGGFIIRYPFLDLLIELNPLVGAKLSYLVMTGEYELEDVELLKTHLIHNDRVMELGAGVGITAALSSVITKHPVVIVDADERLQTLVKRQVELNSGKSELVLGAVTGMEETQEEIDFYLGEELWFSSIYQGNTPKMKKVVVPCLSLNSLLEKYKPTFLHIDIEGAETNLFTCPLRFKPQKMMIELHTPTYGEQKTQIMVERIRSCGYRLVNHKSWTKVFECI